MAHKLRTPRPRVKISTSLVKAVVGGGVREGEGEGEGEGLGRGGV